MTKNNSENKDILNKTNKNIDLTIDYNKVQAVQEQKLLNERVYSISSIIGDKLRFLRKAKNLTLEEVANRSGFTSQAISLCERAKRMPSPNMLLTLSKIYDYSDMGLYHLREETIIDTVQKFGSDAPVSVLNEYEIIMNRTDFDISISDFEVKAHPLSKPLPDFLDLGSEPATEEEIQMAKAYLLALRSINKK